MEENTEISMYGKGHIRVKNTGASELLSSTIPLAGERPYPCVKEDCQKAFTTNYSRKNHMRVHNRSGPKALPEKDKNISLPTTTTTTTCTTTSGGSATTTTSDGSVLSPLQTVLKAAPVAGKVGCYAAGNVCVKYSAVPYILAYRMTWHVR